MPVLSFLAVVGFALIAMLFIADGTLEPSSPPIVTSNRVGLPEPWHPDSMYPDAIRNLTTSLAPAPDMASDLVRAAMPETQSASEDLAKVDPAARAARAEAPPTKKRITRTQPPSEYRRNNTWSQSPGAAREFGLSGFN
jgi:hypothetical protein